MNESNNKISSYNINNFSYRNEIIQCFHVFDNERRGIISVNDLKLIIRALGFRVTKLDVLRNVIESNKRRGIHVQKLDITNKSSAFTKSKSICDEEYDVITNDYGHDSSKDIDLDTVLDIILHPNSKYNRENQSDYEVKMMHKINFRLFDVENKGYITASNIKRVIQDIKEFNDQRALNNGMPIGKNFDDIDDNELRSMIEEFDCDLDGVINEEEFRKIMGHR